MGLFKPNLNQNSLKIASKSTYCFQEKQIDTQIRRALLEKELRKTKEEKEMEECTFQPKLISKQKKSSVAGGPAKPKKTDPDNDSFIPLGSIASEVRKQRRSKDQRAASADSAPDKEIRSQPDVHLDVYNEDLLDGEPKFTSTIVGKSNPDLLVHKDKPIRLDSIKHFIAKVKNSQSTYVFEHQKNKTERNIEDGPTS